jgi:elongation factor Ts
MSVSANLVKELREKTNAGMMDCKKALQETNGDFDAAIEWLRKKGLASAAKKADRVAAEGLVAALVANNGKTGVLVEVNSETDFVAKNDHFKAFVAEVANMVATLNPAPTDAAQLLETKMSTGMNLGDYLKESIARIGENLVVRRFTRVDTTGLVQTYIHGDGKIGVLVELGTTATGDAIKTLANDICLHVAAMSPLAISREEVDATIVSKEREILKAKALEQGKKPEMLDKIVEGQINKFLAESCLLDQAFVKNPDLKVKDQVAAVAKTAGAEITVKKFVRFNLGEGIEKKSTDFAAEVAAQMKGH